MKKFLYIAIVLFLSINLSAQIEGPFSASANLSIDADGLLLSVSYSVDAEKAYLYESMIGVDAPEGVELEALATPEAKKKYDPYQESDVEVFEHDIEYVYRLRGDVKMPLAVTVRFQGCDESLCFMPASKEFSLVLGETGMSSITEEPAAKSDSTDDTSGGFIVVGTAAGYLDSDKFIEFLDGSGESSSSSGNRLKEIFESQGMLAMALLVLLFGLSLNLTPCVLPMIPINIAIIGAGAQAGSKTRGFALGATYGLGIALVYGLLGLLFVKAGTRFGQLNASPVFNIAIGLVFILLSLAMFGVFNLDLTKFQGRIGSGGEKKGSFMTAFVLGSIAALLAGACVAPVVISTLVLALDIYNKGNVLGLILPFLLGAGMALPWPFAGAGLSFLPKAGMWMEKVKYGFGVVIMIAAVYYSGLGIKLAIDSSSASQAAVREASGTKEGWYTSLDEGMSAAAKEGKPLFIDFWASWCKNCLKMEKTTFKDQVVVHRLEEYVKVKFDATNQKDEHVKAVLSKYVEVGLPTYVILKHE